jgi:cytochrome c oxidase subunit 2
MMEKFKELLGMPPLASEHGQGVDALIVYIHWLMIALFVGWIAYFAYVLFRFHKSRNPRADYIGVKSHASSYIELLVAGVEAVLLIFFAVPLWAKTVDAFPKDADATVVQVVAQQFNWNVRYPGADQTFGAQSMHFVKDDNIFGIDPNDPKGKDDLVMNNEIHVPLVLLPKLKATDPDKYKPVIVRISSKDVIHSFKIIAMRITQDAIPGMRIPIHFTPTKTGIFQINCAQLCGNGHYSMSGGKLIVQTQEEYDKWLAGQKPGGGASASDFQ